MSSEPKLQPLDASKLRLGPIPDPKLVPSADSQDVLALKATTDRMIVVSWAAESGWSNPEAIPYGPLSLMPTTSALHYATQCFEGMKAFRGYDGRIRLFRPLYNCERMLASATRVSLPAFDPHEILNLISKLCALEGRKWLSEPGSALYIRPALIGSDSSLGFKVPDEALLYMFLIYWPKGTPEPRMADAAMKPGLKLLSSPESAVRAWPGGTGYAKIGANYGPALLEHSAAKKQGYDQILWLFGPQRQITEASATNFFILWKLPCGSLQIATPPIDDDKMILSGNTRRSVVELSRQMFSSEKADAVIKCAVVEKEITIFEVEDAVKEHRVRSVFVVGTACWVQEVSVIGFDGRDMQIPTGKTPHVNLLRDRLDSIMFGKEESVWTYLVDEN